MLSTLPILAVCCVTYEPKSPPVSVAQWLEHPTRVRKAMGASPNGDLDCFLVPRSRQMNFFKISKFRIREMRVTCS